MHQIPQRHRLLIAQIVSKPNDHQLNFCVTLATPLRFEMRASK